MKKIEPEAMMEMAIIPFVLGFLALLAAVSAVSGSRFLAKSWCVFFVVLSLIGFVDFYWWSYDYGHNLDPTAPLKVPGMSYQPPLIGSKQLLNFTAYSYPAAGGWILILAFVFGAAALLPMKQQLPMMLAALLGCTQGERPIAYGEDVCAHCHMTVSDQRFGAEIVTDKLRVLVYDSVECLAAALRKRTGNDTKVLVADVLTPGSLIELSAAVIVRSKKISSPMGGSLAAFRNREAADQFISSHGGEVIQVESLMKESRPQEMHQHHHSH
jgi:copper chaperone NosL